MGPRKHGIKPASRGSRSRKSEILGFPIYLGPESRIFKTAVHSAELLGFGAGRYQLGASPGLETETHSLKARGYCTFRVTTKTPETGAMSRTSETGRFSVLQGQDLLKIRKISDAKVTRPIYPKPRRLVVMLVQLENTSDGLS